MRRYCWLLAAGILAASIASATNNTVMVDIWGNVVSPQNLVLPTGNVTAVSANFSNLMINGISVIATTGGIVSVNGLASNQVGSLAGAKNVVNNPIGGDVLGFDGANAYWHSISNVTFSLNTLTTVNIFAKSGIINTGSFNRLYLSGIPITNWSQIFGSTAAWAGFPASTTINGNGNGITNLSSIQLGGTRITSWGDLTNSGIVSPSNWANFKAIANIDGNGLYITNLVGIELGGDLIDTWQALTNQVSFPPRTWYLFTAQANIDAGGNTITNLTAIQLDGETITSWGSITNIPALNASNWAVYAATANINGGGHSITNISSIQVGGQTITNLYSTTNVLAWSTFEAIADVNMGGKVITNVETIYLSNGGHITSGSGSLKIGD